MPKDEKPKDKPIDLSSLDGLTLGTAWSAVPPSSPRTERSDRPRSFRPDGDRPQRSGPGRFDKPRGPGKPGEAGRGPRRDFRRDKGGERRGPTIEPPTLKVVFYPEEAPFKALTKAIKASKRTYELFEISRLILEKPERTVATVSQKADAAAKPAPLYQSVADGGVFLTEAEALQCASKTALEKFFKAEEIEVEAPKGNFIVIHKCGITGKLIAPPNYHRYSHLLNEHQAKNLPEMTLPAIQARLESVKEPEAIAQWVESMKKTTRYTLLNTPEGTAPVTFDGADAAAAYLAANHKSELVKAVSQARLTYKQIEALPKGEIRRSIEVSRAMQTKFPLETANNLRGRLRRMGFNLYKRGQKGVSYLSAVKRKFRTVGQTFTPEVQQVIEFIEKNLNTTDAELPKLMLGITPPSAATPAPQASAPAAEGAAPAPDASKAPTVPVSTLTPEEDAALRKLRQTLQWLIEEGYVIQFGNGKLFVPPARLPNAPKTDDEEEVVEEAVEAGSDTPAEAPADATPAAEVNPEPAAEEKKTEGEAPKE